MLNVILLLRTAGFSDAFVLPCLWFIFQQQLLLLFLLHLKLLPKHGCLSDSISIVFCCRRSAGAEAVAVAAAAEAAAVAGAAEAAALGVTDA